MSDQDTAERLMLHRARVLFMLAIAFIAMQGAYIDASVESPLAPVRIGVWVVMAGVLLAFFATGGGGARSAAVRALMNDEGTRLHRARATMIAFYNMMATGAVVYAIGLFKPVTGGQAVHIVMTVGIVSALMAFSSFERVALREAGER